MSARQVSRHQQAVLDRLKATGPATIEDLAAYLGRPERSTAVTVWSLVRREELRRLASNPPTFEIIRARRR